MENPAQSLLRPSSKEKKSKSSSNGFLRILKLFPALTSTCRMVSLLVGRHQRPLLGDNATTATIFGHRRSRAVLAVQENPHSAPTFVAELPMLTAAFHREMAADAVRILLESETRTQRRRVMEEFVWAVFCNGRKVGYTIRRMQMGADEAHVMRLLRGVSMGAGVLPANEAASAADGELTYMRARFQRVVGSKDLESLYMISPDGAATGPELSIFFLRVH